MEESWAAGHRRDGHARPTSAFATPASITRIDDETIADVGSKHQADVLNRNAGVYIQRGSGAESLSAIRSPVLAGAGACGAFLVAEDSLPIRPTGFCNLNEMFELNYEQAGQIEVLRGPGSAMFGASAVHGVDQSSSRPPCARCPTIRVGLEGGSDSFTRVRFAASRTLSGQDPDAGIRRLRRRDARAGLARRFGRRRSQAQSARRSAESAAGSCGCAPRARCSTRKPRASSRATTATGTRTSRADQSESRSFRDASSARVSAQLRATATSSARTATLNVAGIYRRSRMDFLQHFLIGKPLEHNAQTSYMVSGIAAFPSGKLHHAGRTRRRNRQAPSSPNSSPVRPSTARRRPTPFGPPACTTTTRWIPGRWAPRSRSTTASSRI